VVSQAWAKLIAIADRLQYSSLFILIEWTSGAGRTETRAGMSGGGAADTPAGGGGAAAGGGGAFSLS
jgi:hypothetical protein